MLLIVGVGHLWATEAVYKQTIFSPDNNEKGVQNYTSTWINTTNGFVVTTVNANNNSNGWSGAIKIGTKTTASTGTITTNAAIDKAITKVVLTIDEVPYANNVTSITLKTSSNGSTWTSAGTFAKEVGAQTVTLTSPTADLYYQIEVVCTGATKNGCIKFSQVDFYTEESTGGDVIVKTLQSIEVTGMTTTYDQNAAFSFDGTCTATYSVTKNDEPQADEQKEVTPTSVSAPDMTTTGVKTITVSFTDGGVTKNTTYDISVNEHTVTPGTYELLLANAFWGTNGTGANAGHTASGSQYDITVSIDGSSGTQNYINNTETRIYGSHTITFSVPSGYVLKEITGLGTSSKSDIDVASGSSGTINTQVWTGSAQSVTFDVSGRTDFTTVSVTYEIDVELFSIAVKTNPTKTSYIINDAFDATGLVITATYSDASTEDIAYVGNEEKFSFAGFNSASAASAQTITVTYGGKTTTFNVEILDITLQSVTVSGTPTTTSYTAGDTFDPEGLTVTGHYSDNSDVVITTGITWSYPDADNVLTEGQTSIRVVATVEEIASAPYPVSGLTVTAAPLVASWVASEHYNETTDMTAETVAFGPSNNFSIVFGAGTNTQNAPKYYTSGEAVRAYGGNTFALSSNDYKFTKIVISFSSGEGSNDITTNVGTYEAGTWTGNSKEVTFTIGGTTGHRRIASITVTYAEALPSVETPTFSVAEGTYFETQNVTITTATAGATIYYTTDGTEPTTGSSVYSDPIAVSTNMTIKAIAVKDGLENSAVASATYAMGPIFASLEDLVAADLTSNTMVKVSFSNVAIKTIDTNKKYVTFDIQKEGKDIEIYFSAETLPTTWVGGGTLSGTILAPWVRYEKSNVLQCWELKPEAGWQWTDLTYNSPITKTIDHVTVTGTATKTAYVDGEVFDPAGLIVTLYYTDETNEVVTDGITWAPTTALTVGMTSVDVTATVENTTSAVYPVSITVSEIPTKTIAEFIEAGGGRCYLVGVVSNLTNNDKNCTLTDNSGEILLYNISQNGAVTDFVTLDVEEGDRIKVIATTYQVYNQKDEVVAPEFVEELAPEVVAVTGVTVAPTTATVKEGKTITLTATVQPALATNTNVSWESDATGVATVDENGVVTGVAKGTAHITVTTEENSFTATATITVEEGINFAAGDWVLVKDAAELTAGSYVIIAASDAAKAMGSYVSGNNNCPGKDATKGEMLTYSNQFAIFEIGDYKIDEVTYKTFFDVETEEYLYLNANSNYLKAQTDKNENTAWTITSVNSESGLAVVNSKSYPDRSMRYNGNSTSIFACYGSNNTNQKHIVLYKYEEHKFTLTYNKNIEAEVSGMPEAQRANEDNKVTVSTDVPTCGSKIFTGWNTQDDGNGEAKAANAELTLSDDLTLYAQWRDPETVTVSYDANEGTGEMAADADQVEGSTYTIKANAFERNGYLFAGWRAYDANDDELTITNGKFTVPATNVTVKAQWQSATDSKWVLVEHLSQLAIGDKVIIAAKESDYALGAEAGSSNKYRAREAANKAGKLLIPTAGATQLTLGKSGDYYTFKDGDNYLMWSSGNTLPTEASVSDNSLWTISFEEGVMHIVNKKGENENRQIQYNDNSGQERFATYTGAQKAVVLYKYLDIDPENATSGYERTDLILSGIGTICLPYDVKASDRFGGVFYMPSHKTSGFANFIEETGTLKAGKAYIFVAENEFIRLKYSGDEALAPLSDPEKTRGLIGTFTNIVAGNLTGKYVIADNKLRECGSGAYLNAYRAYLDLDKMPEEELTINEPANAPARRRLGVSGSNNMPTGMDELNVSERPVKVMMDGQMFIIRGEKMYDATGKLVK